MISDLDIYRTAALLVRKFGDDAPLQAGTRADLRLDYGDLEGVVLWLKVLAAAKALLAKETEGSVH